MDPVCGKDVQLHIIDFCKIHISIHIACYINNLLLEWESAPPLMKRCGIWLPIMHSLFSISYLTFFYKSFLNFFPFSFNSVQYGIFFFISKYFQDFYGKNKWHQFSHWFLPRRQMPNCSCSIYMWIQLISQTHWMTNKLSDQYLGYYKHIWVLTKWFYRTRIKWAHFYL